MKFPSEEGLQYDPEFGDRGLDNLLEERLLQASRLTNSIEKIESLEKVEETLRLHLGELNFDFFEEELQDLKGFMVFEGDYRRIVFASDLDIHERIRLYLHLTGHIVLGHLGWGDHPQTRYESRNPSRLPPDDQIEDKLVGRWVNKLIYERLKTRCGSDNSLVQTLSIVIPENQA